MEFSDSELKFSDSELKFSDSELDLANIETNGRPYNLAKNQVSAVFHSSVIRRNVSPKFIELFMETPCLCPSEGHKHGGRKLSNRSICH